MSSQGSRSRSSSRGNQRSPSPKRQPKPNKLFITNLESNVDIRKLEEQLKVMFSKFGELTTLVIKRSHNNEYCFGFVDYKEGDDATQAMKELNGIKVGNKEMKVELQDNARRRKATSGGQCYKCGKIGHFARQCRSNIQEQRRGRSRSKERDRKKKKSHRHRSESSESAHAKKKDKKKHKSHKKHKKSKKKHYSSESSDSD